jgi:hypothetical protein
VIRDADGSAVEQSGYSSTNNIFEALRTPSPIKKPVQPSLHHYAASPADEARTTAQFTSLNNLPWEFSDWQVVNLFKKKGVALMVVPAGACSFTLGAYFAALLSGKACTPFGAARYPGDVLVSTYTSHFGEVLRTSMSTFYQSDKTVFFQRTPRRFNWRTPMVSLKEAVADRKPDKVAAIIIDTGAFPKGVDEAIVESAYASLIQLAENADCLILLMVESTSRNVDPFERVPGSLRIFRGTLLAVPLVPKSLGPQQPSLAEFLLVRLVDTAATALAVRFRLEQSYLSPEVSTINWAPIFYGDPRSAFVTCNTVDLTNAQRAAVQLAAQVISVHGPTASSDLLAAAKLNGIAPTTMRDSLSVAKLLNQLGRVRRNDGRWFWIIPGQTPLN